MSGFAIKGGKTLPSIIFNPAEQIFHIHGSSLPENGKDFFDPVLSWLDAYSKKPNPETELLINLEYFNLSTSKALLFMLYTLNQMHEAGHKVKVTWCYCDAYILSAGRDYAFMVRIPFEFRKVHAPDHIPHELTT
ncbi:MAG TPA: DUF1987 domain-containing protein [Bacteroidia bacterium]|jgi:hypothetical protein|nr:DUF1987 domain-containing protein [Bacteroidia bacterium]